MSHPAGQSAPGGVPASAASERNLSKDRSETNTARLARVRENQRRSRARRKDYLTELEEKFRRCEQIGVEASAEMQQAARKVLEENMRLRSLLQSKGITEDELSAFTPPAADDRSHFASPAKGLESLLSTRRTCCPDGDDGGTCCDRSPSSNTASTDTPISTAKSRSSQSPSITIAPNPVIHPAQDPYAPRETALNVTNQYDPYRDIGHDEIIQKNVDPIYGGLPMQPSSPYMTEFTNAAPVYHENWQGLHGDHPYTYPSEPTATQPPTSPFSLLMEEADVSDLLPLESQEQFIRGIGLGEVPEVDKWNQMEGQTQQKR